MQVLKSLNDFLLNATHATSFVVTAIDVEAMEPNNFKRFNDIVMEVRAGGNFSVERVDGGFRFTKIVSREANVYEGGKADDRVTDAVSDNPFRPRYRKLTDPELEYHDGIKTAAWYLLDMFRKVPDIQAFNGIPYTDSQNSEVQANLKLAQRHLEDAVYRAVKALTT